MRASIMAEIQQSAAVQTMDTTATTATPSRTIRERLLGFFEHPLFTLPVGAISGLIGMFYFWPILGLCGVCILLAFHRSGAAKGISKRKTILAYGALFIATTVSMYGAGRLIDKGAHTFLQEIANTVMEKIKPLFQSTKTPSPDVVKPPQTPPPPKGKLVSEVEYVWFGCQCGRFFQNPPVYYQKLDTMAYISVTNLVRRPLSIRGYSMSALVQNRWVHFSNGDSGAFDPFAFGLMNPEKGFFRRIDLSKNGFDYVTREQQLAPDKNLEAWMFFNSGLSLADMKKVKKFDITLIDSAGEKFRWVSDFHPKVIEIPTQLGFLPAEPIPAGLREEPSH